MGNITKKSHYVKPSERRANCGRFTIVTELEDHDMKLQRMYCKSWNCPACREVKIRKFTDSLNGVEIVQYIELEIPKPLQEIKREIDVFLKRLRRGFTSFEYLLVGRNGTSECSIGLFLRSGSVPGREIRQIWSELGLEVNVESELLTRPEGKADKLRAMLDTWSTEDTCIHRLRHSRGFWGPQEKKEADPEHQTSYFSKLSIEHLVHYYETHGYQVERIDQDSAIVRVSSRIKRRSGAPPT